jgi:predicted XRE-type DNA-binding protein
LKSKTPRKTSSAVRTTESSGNVFADLGLANPEQALMKARLTLQIYRIIQDRNLTQTQAAKVLGVKQPHVSLLMRNRAGSFSVGRLTRISHQEFPTGEAGEGKRPIAGGIGAWTVLRDGQQSVSANHRTSPGLVSMVGLLGQVS